MRFCTWLSIIILSYFVTVSVIAQTGTPIQPKPPAAPPPIAIIPSDGMNLKILEQPTPDTLIVTVDPPVHNWFCGKLVNLPTDREVTIGMSLAGIKDADVRKWQGLRPVMTYGDPTKYETYEWYQKDKNGRWVSGDPFKKGEAHYAGYGTLPIQSVIPGEVAAQFLSKDGKYWQPWQEVDDAKANTDLNIFRIKQKFQCTTATLAMRIPYLYSYQQDFIYKIKNKFPGVSVDEIGSVDSLRKLQIIRVEDSNTPVNLKFVGYIESVKYTKIPLWITNQNTSNKSIIIIYAREHGTEHDSSWLIYGLIKTLLTQNELSKELLKKYIWLFVPLEDPDSAENAEIGGMAESFYTNDYNCAVVNYLSYLRSFFNKGYGFSIALTIHSVECNEFSNYAMPFVGKNDFNASKLFYNICKSEFINNNYLVMNDFPASPIEDKWFDYSMNSRLGGWLRNYYKTMFMLAEINSRYPSNRLSLYDVINMGSILLKSLSLFTKDEEYIIRERIASNFASNRYAVMSNFNYENITLIDLYNGY
ncbi:MAG: M14 family zinc carboxypeptidase [Armatimonadota bacterium]